MQSTHDETRKVELVIGKILRVGVITSAIVILIGMALYFMNGAGYPTIVKNGQSMIDFPKRFSDIFAGIIAGKSYAVIMLGVFLLILTPVLRVVVSIYAFYKEHDNLYVIITTIVLIILMIAMFLGYRS
ncbi:membrane protein [Companilactobacillus crustorum]|uniref:Integral membrane protein n=3 Tax=Companilactobacillus TaxID=2767879 RepID=A0A837RGT7_9LACO|nr:DUF1634 domain-containing protein [Companilactobacillus crustorum]HCD08368.1 DUF1634 domain-containing protein [Lactobacillus sp.]APU72481.1 hypothetical protein BI355_2187 [Companilactobacillus crustorum]KRK41088.1 hypothetical protein FD26_GL001784 [Companilactobacillus crustorum JCM 15951]KRO17510.1 hypothetical protein IV63_GL001808 [Companilactobacillus crustorum]WDT65484.1 DUF1634 domain-containing protein [Companilactobacillus crustorum]